MTEQAFTELKNSNPIIAELCEKLGLVRDSDYYDSPEGQRIERHKRYEALAKQYFSDVPYLLKESVLARLKEQYPDTDEKKDMDKAVLKYWLQTKIITEGEGELLFLGQEVPEEYRIKSPIEKAQDLAKEIMSRVQLITARDLISVLRLCKVKAPKQEIKFWLKNKIVSSGYATFGTNRQTRKLIFYLGDCPF